MNFLQHKTRGFTLIELLVVISIISLLSSVVLAGLESARAKARDSRRVSDIRVLRQVLEIYRNTESSGAYPPSGGAGTYPNPSWSNSSVVASWQAGGVFPNAVATYIQNLPVDPINGTGWSGNSATYNYSYIYCNASTYMVVYRLERPNGEISPGAQCGGQFYNYGYANVPNVPSTGTITVGAPR